jgi:hypothetical protein
VLNGYCFLFDDAKVSISSDMTKYLSNYFAIFGHFIAFSRENTRKSPEGAETDAPSGPQRIY